MNLAILALIGLAGLGYIFLLLPKIQNYAAAVAPTAAPVKPKPAAATTAGDILWDSNRDGKWNNGVKRTVKGTEGNQSPNGKGIYTAASGSPRLHIDGDGVAHLEADGGHGRFYVKACNYNAQLSGDLMFEDSNIDNTTWKIRNRHGMGGACENRFGGIGGVITRAGGVEVKIEKCHNIHEGGTKKTLPKPPTVGQWMGFRFTVVDTPDKKGIKQTVEVDYKDGKGFIEVLNTTFPNPPAFYVDQTTFEKASEFWIRINNTKTGKVAYRNVKLTKVSPSSSSSANVATVRKLMIDEPYLYNGYYHGRRL